MITTIIFDLSEVYLYGLVGSYRHLGEKINESISDKNYFLPELNQLFHGRISEDAYLQAVISKNSWEISIKQLKSAIRKNFIEIKGTREVIENVKKRGYKIALLSNHSKEWIEFCEGKYNYHKLFDYIMYSYEVDILKPDKKIFNLVFEKFNINPSESVFIDDNLKNIRTARELKMKTVHFTSAQNLEKDLIRLSIL